MPARERINKSQYGRRDSQGRFKEVEGTRRSNATDRKRKASTKSRSGYGDKGDR